MAKKPKEPVCEVTPVKAPPRKPRATTTAKKKKAATADFLLDVATPAAGLGIVAILLSILVGIKKFFGQLVPAAPTVPVTTKLPVAKDPETTKKPAFTPKPVSVPVVKPATASKPKSGAAIPTDITAMPGEDYFKPKKK